MLQSSHLAREYLPPNLETIETITIVNPSWTPSTAYMETQTLKHLVKEMGYK